MLASTRLLTLSGTGGVGKTRLALEVAARLFDEYPHSVRLVELAALTDAVLVPQVVAAALDVREESGRPVEASLADALHGKHLLIVLDNCEHLVKACGVLVDGLLRSCPSLSVLVTSREVLGIAGEVTWRVPPLSMPAFGQIPPPPNRAVRSCALVRRASELQSSRASR